MTLRTLTFDPAVYKLVPVEPIPKMLIAAGTVRGYDGAAPDEDHIAWWDEMLAAVPDTLPGVVEHSGEPIAYATIKDGRYSIAWEPTAPPGEHKLFTHAAPAKRSGETEMRSAFEAKYGPTPERMSQKRAFAWLDWKMAWEAAISAQPVERQELSAAVIADSIYRTTGINERQNPDEYEEMLKLCRAIIAADRGQA